MKENGVLHKKKAFQKFLHNTQQADIEWDFSHYLLR